jgi:hypothetical protein
MPSMVGSDQRTASRSGSRTFKREDRCVHEAIKNERGTNNTVLIAVVQEESLSALEEKCRSSWWPWSLPWCESNKCRCLLTTVLIKGHLASRIIVTTAERLQTKIDEVCRTTSHKNMSFLVSPKLTEISFDVPSKIRKLRIIRCGRGLRRFRNGNLTIPADSTFCGVRLDSWENRNKFLGYELCMPGVSVRLDLRGYTPSSVSTSRLSTQDTARIGEELDEIVTSPGIERLSWWEQWKGSISIIIGLLAGAGTVCASLKVSAGGIYVEHWLGLKIFAGYFHASAAMSIAAPAAAVAVGTAAIIYFVPWSDLFSWLGKMLSRFWGLVQQAWYYLLSKLGFDEKTPVSRTRPVEFSW